MFKVNPLDSMYITSPFGFRIHPIHNIRRFHNGVDLRAPVGTPLRSVDDGFVVVSKSNNGGPSVGLGWYIVVQYSSYYVVYAHMRALGLPVGRKVERGEIVGYSGASGAVKGAHLHFEVRKGKYDYGAWRKDSQGRYLNAVDPEEYFYNPDENKELVEKLLEVGAVTSRDYWLNVFNKVHPANPDYIKIMVERLLDKIK